MILKYFQKDGWVFIDGISRFESKRLIKQEPESQFIMANFQSNGERYDLNFDVTSDENRHTIFLLNDEGKTIECIN